MEEKDILQTEIPEETAASDFDAEPAGAIPEETPVPEEAETTATPEKKNTCKITAAVKACMAKATEKMGCLKCRKIRRTILLIAVVLIGAIVIGTAYNAMTNNYNTPIKTLQKYTNLREYDVQEAALEYGNGLGESSWKRIRGLLQQSELFEKSMDQLEKLIVKQYDANLDKYGEDYKVQFIEKEKIPLEMGELRDYRVQMQRYVYLYEDLADETEEFKTSDWTELSRDLDMSKADTKTLISEFRILADSMGRLRVTEGYEVVLNRVVTGSLLEAPEETVQSVIVLNVNGRWIRFEDFGNVFTLFTEYMD